MMQLEETESPSQELVQKIERLRESVEYLMREVQDLNDDVSRLSEQVPAERKVMEIKVDGVWWFTDGWRAIRDAWPGLYTARPDKPDLRPLLESWEAVTAPAPVVEYANRYQMNLARLSSGVWLDYDQARELIAGRGYTTHNEGGPTVVFRDREGRVAAVQMQTTVNEELIRNRRPEFEQADQESSEIQEGQGDA